MTLSPITTATLQATVLSTASNICAQVLDAHREQRRLSLDAVQLLRFVLLTLLTTPPNYHWQQFLERRLPAYAAPRKPRCEDVELRGGEGGEGGGRDASRDEQEQDERDKQEQRGSGATFSYGNTLAKWFIDCMTVGAVLNTLAFLVVMGLLKARSLDEIWQSVVDDTIPIIVAGYRIWPVASIISFSVIPVSKRIVFLSFVGFLWGIYMSMVAARV